MTRTEFTRRLAWLEGQQRPQQVPPDALELLTMAGITPDPWQVQVVQSSAPRLLLNCCRQSGKSTVSAALALSTALHESEALVLVLSPTLRQSQELFRKFLDLYIPIAGTIAAHQESALRLELRNGSRIISLPGTEGTVRGHSGVELLIIDEAARVPDALYYSVRPMLAISGGRLIALSTPFGQRGWFFQEWTQGEHWVQVKISADRCLRISASFLEEEKRSLPPLWFKSEYLCEFVDHIAQVFASELVLGAVSADVAPLF
jgi:hypothetical protein